MQLFIKIFTLSTCIHCKAAKKLLNDCAVKYEFTDVDLLTGRDRENAIKDVERFNPECTFPTIIIGDKVIVGFQETEIRNALGL
jgi:glutaredoxin-like protein NrdH